MTALLPRIELESAPNPTAAVIWLHGLGADGNDFAGLVPELDLASCQPIRFVFPHAPSIPITINGGYVMPAWYDLYGMDLVSKQDDRGIQKSEWAINALIENEVVRGIPYERIVLAGFSQGCAMALHTALRLPHKIAGVMALSGYLPLADRFPSERHAANARTPIFMAHGTQDPVVVIQRGEESRDALVKLGHPVQWHTYPMPHSVHPREIADISAFLTQVLGIAA
ncbi:alpha/beta fold hydrolase [Rhodoferax saidenbachensis]|uniref:Phospholipase/carboxylesterase n=1 Tax=Rhodoferax saidenbachensis TaxID=1484693 RepID=A0ABU1ZS31_9BURK|nr:alpha/beta fold hydrolase [Rhodoferax saidenbachensis]MDR7308361.1 phospholipase/carboxylesterase [Rhodoferax saidenbachensis]